MKNIFYNSNYDNKPLYGCGIFPFWIYLKYFGRPVYKFSRKKLKFNVYFSIFNSHFLGAFIHATPFLLEGKYFSSLIFFISSFIIFPFLFYLLHKYTS